LRRLDITAAITRISTTTTAAMMIGVAHIAR
jgi:hypothetical protein